MRNKCLRWKLGLAVLGALASHAHGQMLSQDRLWVEHPKLGNVHVSGNYLWNSRLGWVQWHQTEEGLYLYDPLLGNLWTADSVLPFLYSFDAGEWLRLQPESNHELRILDVVPVVEAEPDAKARRPGTASLVTTSADVERFAAFEDSLLVPGAQTYTVPSRPALPKAGAGVTPVTGGNTLPIFDNVKVTATTSGFKDFRLGPVAIPMPTDVACGFFISDTDVKYTLRPPFKVLNSNTLQATDGPVTVIMTLKQGDGPFAQWDVTIKSEVPIKLFEVSFSEIGKAGYDSTTYFARFAYSGLGIVGLQPTTAPAKLWLAAWGEQPFSMQGGSGKLSIRSIDGVGRKLWKAKLLLGLDETYDAIVATHSRYATRTMPMIWPRETYADYRPILAIMPAWQNLGVDVRVDHLAEPYALADQRWVDEFIARVVNETIKNARLTKAQAIIWWDSDGGAPHPIGGYTGIGASVHPMLERPIREGIAKLKAELKIPVGCLIRIDKGEWLASEKRFRRVRTDPVWIGIEQMMLTAQTKFGCDPIFYLDSTSGDFNEIAPIVKLHPTWTICGENFSSLNTNGWPFGPGFLNPDHFASQWTALDVVQQVYPQATAFFMTLNFGGAAGTDYRAQWEEPMRKMLRRGGIPIMRGDWSGHGFLDVLEVIKDEAYKDLGANSPFLKP